MDRWMRIELEMWFESNGNQNDPFCRDAFVVLFVVDDFVDDVTSTKH